VSHDEHAAHAVSHNAAHRRLYSSCQLVVIAIVSNVTAWHCAVPHESRATSNRCRFGRGHKRVDHSVRSRSGSEEENVALSGIGAAERQWTWAENVALDAVIS
jgi:hypothetical protein